MYSLIFSVVLPLLATVPAQTAAAGDSRPQKSRPQPAKHASLAQFVEMVMTKGRDWTLFADRRGPLLGFSEEGAPSKALAENDREVKMAHMCNIIFDEKSSTKKPVCLVLQTTANYSNQRKIQEWYFRFNLEGALEKAILAVGDTDDEGKGVEGSAVDSEKDIKDPEVRKRADQELKYWLKNAASVAKKVSAPKPTEASAKTGPDQNK
ncbi:MAG: hypothetical protein HY077_17115 [Elusimicrobia bacterium]|nr:hypothetical protein [Elusimicrobiota bacterium]